MSRPHVSAVTLYELLVGFAALSLAVATLWFRLDASLLRQAEPVPARAVLDPQMPSPVALRLASLGHHEAMADLLWLEALSRFGETYGLSRDPRWMDANIESILAVDPRFRVVYEWAGTVVMYGSVINRDSVALSTRYLERGLERFPDDASLLSMAAVNYLFEMKPISPEEAARFKQRGGELLIRAAATPFASPTIRLAAATAARRSGSLELGMETLRHSIVADLPRAEVASLRFQIESITRGADTEEMLRRRGVLNLMAQDPRWGAMRIDTAAILHPEPLYLFEPVELTPAPGAMFR